MMQRNFRDIRPTGEHSVQRKRYVIIGVMCATVLIVAAALVPLFVNRDQSQTSQHSEAAAEEVSETQTAPEPQTSKPPLINLQPTVDGWLARQNGDYGIVVYDPASQQIIAQHNSDKLFFAASIYKLYVVYLALQDVDTAKYSLQEPFLAGKTRQQCLYDAIQSSDSPCAETLLAETGQAQANARLTALGLQHATFPDFTTSAAEVARLLARLQSRQDLSETSTNSLLESMKNQVYRNGLPKGVPSATVYDKVGFSETPNYHDVGIIRLPNNREYIVAFLSEGAGSRQAADFAATIYAVLQNP